MAGLARLLIANRGEIACRIIRTARGMGIGTVAVHSDADADALHVHLADTAVRIGPAPAAESYLCGDAILAAARATGADAIHPGYGFLSENADFAEAVEAAGLIFVGPTPDAIRAMGLKDRAKALMAAAGVPVVPGYHGADQDDARLAQEAEAIGWPLLIKAVAGGGGKGMRLVARAEEFPAALAGARREAQAAFGNPAVLLEKFVTTPRHIEIQVFGDGTRALHLWERDCSLQRRHQKVIEEAPAPGMTEALRAAMGQAAVRAAEAIGYRGAGTVEFIADGAGPLRPDGFWFMEMNTRLQVEHPVTEEILGLDLVEWQLRLAGGEGLPCTQGELRARGHAVEARLYAEDPAAGFLPATGRLSALDWPEGLRVETGVRAGDEITPHYDPMIAKLIAHGPDRATAIARLRRGLAQVRLGGLVTNLGFLHDLLGAEDFAAGRPDTGLIDRLGPPGPPPPDPPLLALAALALAGLPAPGADGFAPWTALRHRLAFAGPGGVHAAWITVARGALTVEVGGAALTLAAAEATAAHVRAVIGGRRVSALLVREGAGVTLLRDGHAYAFHPVTPGAGERAEATADTLEAPMTGLVRALHTRPGAEVAAGEALLVLEAMKMEHTLRAPRAGRVARVETAEGAQVARGTLLIALEPEE